MPRPPRVQFPGALYHVTARGVARQRVFRDDADRELLLYRLAETVVRFRWLCHAYCLMGTHWHLLVETPAANLAAGMQRLNGIYAQAFNRRWARPGHLFQGRYHAVLVEKEPHLLEVARYVVLNPVRAGLCRAPEAWPWSSYPATAGLVAPPSFLAVDELLGGLLGGYGDAQALYREFVSGGVSRARATSASLQAR